MNCLNKKMIKARQPVDAYGEISQTFLRFADYNTGVVLHEMCGFGKKRLSEFYVESYKMLTEMMEKYAGKDDDDRESVSLSALAIINKLQAIGVDAQMILDCNDRYFTDRFTRYHHSARERAKHARRLEFVNAAKPVMYAYYLSVVWYLREKHNLSSRRIDGTLVKLLENYNDFAEHYLYCEESSDMYCLDMIENGDKLLREMGI